MRDGGKCLFLRRSWSHSRRLGVSCAPKAGGRGAWSSVSQAPYRPNGALVIDATPQCAGGPAIAHLGQVGITRCVWSAWAGKSGLGQSGHAGEILLREVDRSSAIAAMFVASTRLRRCRPTRRMFGDAIARDAVESRGVDRIDAGPVVIARRSYPEPVARSAAIRRVRKVRDYCKPAAMRRNRNLVGGNAKGDAVANVAT